MAKFGFCFKIFHKYNRLFSRKKKKRFRFCFVWREERVWARKGANEMEKENWAKANSRKPPASANNCRRKAAYTWVTDGHIG